MAFKYLEEASTPLSQQYTLAERSYALRLSKCRSHNSYLKKLFLGLKTLTGLGFYRLLQSKAEYKWRRFAPPLVFCFWFVVIHMSKACQNFGELVLKLRNLK